MEYKSYKTYGNVIVAQRADYQWGVLNFEGKEIVPFGKYGWIDGFDQGLARVRTHRYSGRVGNVVVVIDGFASKNHQVAEGRGNLEIYMKSDRSKNPDKYAKWGIINQEGEEVLPVEYDDIWNFLGKGRYSTKVIKGDDEEEVYFHDLNSELPVRGISRSYLDEHEYDDNWGRDDGIDYEEETWYALTDGMYGDYPGPGFDYDCLGF